VCYDRPAAETDMSRVWHSKLLQFLHQTKERYTIFTANVQKRLKGVDTHSSVTLY